MKKYYWMKQSRLENITYLVVWVLLFVSPLLNAYMRTTSDASLTFDWMDVFAVWRKFAVFLLLFLVHNFLLAPQLVHRRRRTLYFSVAAAIVVLFAVYQCNSKPPHARGPHGDFDRPEGHERPLPELREGDHRPHRDHQHQGDTPPLGGEPEIMAVALLILMFGANIGVKGYIHSREDRKRLAELEKQTLEQQLEYLRYQINPHFFMNTLNNIHALVTIDPDKAQETIVELSKMMRFVLYEGNKNVVPLTKELEFIRTYIKLMQLRYTDKVRIELDLPSEVPDRSVPPLMLISFIENAFKHGISYQRPSFIEIAITLEGDTLHFSCRNSKAEVSNQEKGGVGLVNVRKRLDLLYDHRYTLTIHDDPDTYHVTLIIPL